MMLKKIIIYGIIFLFFTNIALAQSAYEITTKYAALRGEWEEVIENGKEWLKEETDNPLPHLLLGLGYYFTKEYQKSYSEYKAYKNLIKSKEVKSRVINWGGNLVKENPQSYLAYYILADVYSCISPHDIETTEGKERIRNAIVALKKVIEINPNFSAAYGFLASTISVEALDIKSLMESFPSKALENKLNSLLEEAITYSEKAASLEADTVSTYLGLASVCLVKEEYDLAISNAQKIVELAPTPYIYMFLGEIYLAKKEYDLAIEYAKKSTELDPQEALLYSLLSFCYCGKGLYTEAIDAAQKAIALDPGNDGLWAYFALGMSYYQIGQITESKKYFNKVVDISPDSEFGFLAKFTLAMIEAAEKGRKGE